MQIACVIIYEKYVILSHSDTFSLVSRETNYLLHQLRSDGLSCLPIDRRLIRTNPAIPPKIKPHMKAIHTVFNASPPLYSWSIYSSLWITHTKIISIHRVVIDSAIAVVVIIDKHCIMLTCCNNQFAYYKL